MIQECNPEVWQLYSIMNSNKIWQWLRLQWVSMYNKILVKRHKLSIRQAAEKGFLKLKEQHGSSRLFKRSIKPCEAGHQYPFIIIFPHLSKCQTGTAGSTVHVLYVQRGPRVALSQAWKVTSHLMDWFEHKSLTSAPAYFSLTLVLGQVDLFKHLRSLLHHQSLLIGIGRDVTIMLRERKSSCLRGSLLRPILIFFLCCPRSYHFHNFHHGIDAEVIEECGQVLLHLDAVVVHLGHGEDAHLALPPNLRGTNGNTSTIVPSQLPATFILLHLTWVASFGTLKQDTNQEAKAFSVGVWEVPH